MTAMARLEAQESIEYYQWLFRIEREQFEYFHGHLLHSGFHQDSLYS